MKASTYRLIPAALMTAGLLAGCASTPAPEEGGASDIQAEAQRSIEAAEAKRKEAAALGYEWRDTGKLIKKAKAAYDSGDYAKADKLADEATFQSTMAIDQYYLQQAKFKLEKYKGMKGLNDEQKALLQKAEAAYLDARGHDAYAAVTALEASLASARIQYTVVRGDNLWNISAKDSIYGNPYEWPLIYKANADKIKDPDLIYPGQEFGIDRNPSADEVARAVEHAKTRGAWSLGTVEESDLRYLGK